MAQLVEHLLAKEKVAGSNPVFRSKLIGVELSVVVATFLLGPL